MKRRDAANDDQFTLRDATEGLRQSEIVHGDSGCVVYNTVLCMNAYDVLSISGRRLHEPRTLEKVQRVCERAMKEFAIEKALDDMAGAWTEVSLEVVSYRATGTYVIKARPHLPNMATRRCSHLPNMAGVRRDQHAARRPPRAHAAVLLLAV